MGHVFSRHAKRKFFHLPKSATVAAAGATVLPCEWECLHFFQLIVTIYMHIAHAIDIECATEESAANWVVQNEQLYVDAQPMTWLNMCCIEQNTANDA